MLRSERPEKPKKVYIIPKVSKKRAAAIATGTFQPKPKAPIKPRSDKRAKQEREYLNKTAPTYKKAHPICERCNMRPTTEIHHKKGRINKLLNDDSKFIGLCNECHVYAENNPTAAKAEGISIMRTN